MKIGKNKLSSSFNENAWNKLCKNKFADIK